MHIYSFYWQDLHTVDLTAYFEGQQARVNITGLKLVRDNWVQPCVISPNPLIDHSQIKVRSGQGHTEHGDLWTLSFSHRLKLNMS